MSRSYVLQNHGKLIAGYTVLCQEHKVLSVQQLPSAQPNLAQNSLDHYPTALTSEAQMKQMPLHFVYTCTVELSASYHCERPLGVCAL